MTDSEIIELVHRMREAQRNFYALRRQPGDHFGALDEARRLERLVDKALAERGRTEQGRLL